MALQHHARPFQSTRIPIGADTISLPNEIIKSYLPNLWRFKGRRALARGHLNLERLVFGEGDSARIALSIILIALEASKTDRGVASELKIQLDDARDKYTLNRPDPERAMCRIFCNVVELLDPRSALGRHQEMAYAMSGWFTDLAAEGIMHSHTLFSYVQALGLLEADMTAPLLCFLRRIDVRSCDLRYWTRDRVFRQKTIRKMRFLLKSHPGEASLVPRDGLISGGDLRAKEIIKQWRRDPGSITIDLRPQRQGRLDDDGYATYSDSDLDDHFYIDGHLPFDHCSAPFDPVLCGHFPPGLPQYQYPWISQAPIGALRSPSPMSVATSLQALARPAARRTRTAYV